MSPFEEFDEAIDDTDYDYLRHMELRFFFPQNSGSTSQLSLAELAINDPRASIGEFRSTSQSTIEGRR